MWDSIAKLLNQFASWLALAVAYFGGRASKANEIEMKNLQKQKEYAEIEAKERTDDDLIKSIEDGTF